MASIRPSKMVDGDNFSSGFLNHALKEELEEAYDDFEDDIVIKYEPKYAEVMQESFFENDYLTSNTSETELLETLSTKKNSENSNMIIPLRIKCEEEDCEPDKTTQLCHYVVNSTERSQENVTESLASGIHATQLAAGDNNSESNIDGSNKKDPASNALDSNTKTIDVCNELILNRSRSNFRCLKCSYVTMWRCVIQSHVKSHIRFKNSSCGGCNFESTPFALRHHQYKCKLFLLKNPLSQRQENKNNKNPPYFRCPECSYVTRSKSILEPHVKTHKNFENSSCDGCNFKSTSRVLKYHQIRCKSFLLKNPLSQHQENKDNRNSSGFSCPKCSYVTTRKSNFEAHLKSHINYQNLSCDGCNFKSTPIAVKYHQYKCESYLLKNPLPQHQEMKNNRNLTRLSCPECSFVTTGKSNFEAHVKSHINSKNVSCDGCNYKSTPTALRHHQYNCESYLRKNPLPKRQEN